MCKLSEFIALLESQVDRGIYVWGGNGEDLTAMNNPAAWIERRETSVENVKRDIALFEKRKNDGVNPIQAFDCSGLVYWALHTLGLQGTDLSSRGFYSLCRHIEEEDLRVGDLVFHHDGTQIVHVGVCVGEEQIECKGRDVGVVKNRRKAGYWNRFGRLPCFEDEPTPEPDPEPTPEPPAPTEKLVKVVGGSVRVRNGNGASNVQIGTAHNAKWYKDHKINKPSDTFPLIRQCEEYPNWYCIEYKGQIGYITSMPRYTEVIDK